MAASVLNWLSATLGFLRTKSSTIVAPDKKNLKLKVAMTTYGIAVIKVANSEVGRCIKKEALEIFAQSAKFPFASTSEGINDNMIAKFKLIRVKTKMEVEDFEYLKNINVQNNEEFLMIARRSKVDDSLIGENLAGPTEFQIREKTSAVKKSPSSPPIFRINEMLQNDDMRKVFITLAREAAYVLGMSPYADNLIAFYRQRILNYIKNHKNAEKVMVQLGFALDRVQYAIKLKADNYKSALDWLIDNETSSGYHDDHDIESPKSSARASCVTSARRDSILSAKYEPTNQMKDRIDGLLEIVNFFAEKDELVYEDNIFDLIVMGYDVEVARDALRITRNNVGAAIAHIHGDENRSITELRHGLSASSKIREQILASPQIQLSLNNPKFFALYINILDNPTQVNSWYSYSDIGTLMKHIIIKFHEEKYISAANQFNGSRLPISALSSPLI